MTNIIISLDDYREAKRLESIDGPIRGILFASLISVSLFWVPVTLGGWLLLHVIGIF